MTSSAETEIPRFRLWLVLWAAALLCPTQLQPFDPSTSGNAPVGINIEINEQSVSNLAEVSHISDSEGQDENGWPTSNFTLFFDNRYVFAWDPANQNQDPLRFTTNLGGHYKLSFTGQALPYIYQYGQIVARFPDYDASSNLSVAEFDLMEPFIQIFFVKTKRTPDSAEGTGVTNIRLIRDDNAKKPQSIFTDLWIDSIVKYGWSVLRCLDINKGNNYGIPGTKEAYPYLLNWSTDRRLPQSGPLYESLHPGVHELLPWEDLVILAQITHKDLWINIPVNASKNYIDELAKLFANGNAFTGNTGIPKDVNLYVEYSNELWHQDFPQGEWNFQAARDEVKAGGTNLNYDGAMLPEQWRFRRIAQKTIEIGQQFRSAFSNRAGRIRPVINNHLTDHDFDMLQYVTANYGKPANVLYGISQQGYYTSKDASSPRKVLDGERTASDLNRPGYVLSRTIATYFGLHSLAYEGGAEERGGKDPKVPDRGLVNKLAAARDPAVKDVILHDLLDNWFPSGGELYVAYHQVGRYSFWGTYGDTEDLTNLHTGKWAGHVAVMNTPLPATTAGTLAPSKASESVEIPLNPPYGDNKPMPASEPCAMLLLRVPSAGEYSLAVQAKPGGPAAKLRVMIDNSPLSVPDGGSDVMRTHMSPGLHSLFVFLDGKANATLAAGATLKLTAEQMEAR